MDYRMYRLGGGEPVNALEAHVLARAYRAAWRARTAGEPAGPHLIAGLDLLIDFEADAPNSREPYGGHACADPTAMAGARERIQANETPSDLVAHVPAGGEMKVKPVQPTVDGPHTKYAGWYRLGTRPQSLAGHNLASWRIVAAILEAYGSADFWDLAVAVRGHQHGTKNAKGPQSFVRYCIRNGWLERAG